MSENNLNLLKLYIGEAIGTFFLVFMGCGSIILYSISPEIINPMLIPLIFGGTVLVMIYALGHLTGAHFNPAVSIGFAIARHFPLNKLIGYILGQLTGATLASLLHLFLFRNSIHNFGMTEISVGLPEAFIFEIVLSFLLMFIIISVATDTRACSSMAGMAIGATVTICAAFGGPLTGASMNPARSFGPALMALDFTNIYLYILAPIIGASIAAITYEKLRCCLDSCRCDDEEKKKKSDKQC